MTPQEIALRIAVLEDRLETARRFIEATLHSLEFLREDVMRLPEPMKKTEEVWSGPNVWAPQPCPRDPDA